MCGDSPPAPDPYATAQAQNMVNKDAIKTAAQYNQINQNNPFGSLTYSGENPRDLTQQEQYDLQSGKMTQAQAAAIQNGNRAQNVSLNPQLQQLLGTQETNANKLATMGSNLIDATGNIAPFDPGTNPVGYLDSGNAGLARSLNPSAPLQASITGPSNGLQTSVNAGGVQSALDTSGVQQTQGQVAGTGNLAPQIQSATQGAYQAQTGLLQPGFDQAQQHLQSQLAAQGIEQGTPAYNDAVNNLRRSQGEIQQQAAASAVNQGLSAQGQLFGENVTSGQFANSASAQQFQQALQSGQFGNEAQALSFGQGVQNAQLNNSANQQAFTQQMGQAQLNNETANQKFAQDLAAAQFQNQATGQAFNQNVQQNNANQSVYQQGFQNDQATQTQNLNALLALNSGQQLAPTTPQFNPYAQTTASQAAPNLIGLAGSNYQSQMANSGGVLGSIFGAAGQIGAAAVACWVAREVFGEDDPQWLRMRLWMLTKAPDALLATYLRVGSRYAEWIKDKPELKADIRREMEVILAA